MVSLFRKRFYNSLITLIVAIEDILSSRKTTCPLSKGKWGGLFIEPDTVGRPFGLRSLLPSLANSSLRKKKTAARSGLVNCAKHPYTRLLARTVCARARVWGSAQ